MSAIFCHDDGHFHKCLIFAQEMSMSAISATFLDRDRQIHKHLVREGTGFLLEPLYDTMLTWNGPKMIKSLSDNKIYFSQEQHMFSV
jgi:hypothetical protein